MSERMSGAERDRLNTLAESVWHEVFAMLDGEVEISGFDAGRIATACEHAFRAAYTEPAPEMPCGHVYVGGDPEWCATCERLEKMADARTAR